MGIADDIRAVAISTEPSPIEDVICSVMLTDDELMLPTYPGEQYRTFLLVVAESFDDRDQRERLETARANAAREASHWAQEARTHRSTVLGILRYFELPENDWEALHLIRRHLEGSHAKCPTCGSAGNAGVEQKLRNIRNALYTEQLRNALQTLLDLCAIGDVDEHTEEFGWGDAIASAKILLDADAAVPRGVPMGAGGSKPAQDTDEGAAP